MDLWEAEILDIPGDDGVDITADSLDYQQYAHQYHDQFNLPFTLYQY